MSVRAQNRSREFLKVSGQFKLGALVTEASHPVTSSLSEVAQNDISAARDLRIQGDGEVVNKFREFVASAHAGEITANIQGTRRRLMKKLAGSG